MSRVKQQAQIEVREERVPAEYAIAFLFGNDIPTWIGAAISDEQCEDQCQGCPDRDFCWFVRREESLEDLAPVWQVSFSQSY